jgi:uncharacterized protein YndB with AHSA1/START domain
MVASSGSTRIEVIGRKFRMTRTFDAPRDLVWNAWTDAEALKQWWGPREWPTTYCTVDFRVGGLWHYCMTGPNGEEAWGRATYRQITPQERILYLDEFSDKDGNAASGMPATEVTLEFVEQDGKTTVISTAEYASDADLKKVVEMGVEQGASETWDRLAEYLA